MVNLHVSSLVSPLEGAIASQISQLGMLEASTARTGIHTSCVSAWLTVLRMILQGYRLQIAMKHPRFSSVLFSHTEESTAHVLKEEISSLLNKGAIQVVPHNLINQGFFSRYFLEGRFPPSYSGPQAVEQTFEEIQIHNVNPWFARPCHETERLVHIGRSERCFFPYKHLSTTPEVSSFRLSRHLLRTHGASVRAKIKPPNFLFACGSGLHSPKNVWSADPDIHMRLAHHSRFEGKGVAGHLLCARAHPISGLQGECEQEQLYTQSEGDLPGHGAELSLHASASLSRARSLSDELSVTVQRGGEGAILHMSQATGSYGFSYPVFATRTPEDEGVHEMGFVTTFQPVTRSLPLCNSDTHLRCSSAPLEERGLLRTGYPSGDCHVAESRDDGRVPNRLGCHPGGQNCERFAAEQTTFRAHRLFRASNQLEGSESFSASSAGTSCARTLRRYHDSGYQSSRRRALAEASCPSLQAFGMEWASFPVVTRDSCSGNSEQRRGSSIEGEPALRRLAPPPSDSRHDMDEVTDARRSVRLARKQPLSYVLLAKGLGRAHPWPRVLLYAFPPLCLIILTLARAREGFFSLILIAPRWPKAPWLAEIIPLLYAQPWCLPLRTDLLS
ncbi:uncharacterized protein [Pseudorasbora parva]|uniref:uncharacterized protein isoform X1 n=1 Tax=Pseudorasbora parva TaxID=51549 RepID=UPI00351F7782